MNPGRMIRQVLYSLLKKPATNRYPYEKLDMPGQIRGKLKFTPKLCIGCKLCMRDCPSGAIKINKIADKQFEAEIDMSKCIYCAQCVEVCMKKALEFTNDIELAELDPAKLKVVFRDEPQGTTQSKAE